ncbi:hypothetical protein BOTBODRAFT_37639 [Botryobasidium botryosum FD-172 SS1]|uniref:NADH:flavin oxidoreductase/NADH oxidase N-terminal domain-containing protein n=1 Tax=Botryobasidium botryosum (strain FD-172 SS1) TaxID=930990 RepID=A0A067LZT1_BOTB1|nr:hypothetical protein BOTBODRAFT_37639 [Botryobasidium botryosum FD-172 SS1]
MPYFPPVSVPQGPSFSSKLFEPIQVGDVTLQHRVAMAPLTRYRADEEHVHGQIAVDYYAQRASTPGTLLFTEATFIAPEAGGYANVPGIYTDAQIAAWKKVTDAVHAHGSFIYLQLWALGRTAEPAVLAAEGHDLVAPSAIPKPGGATPRALTAEEVKKYVRLYAQAARNAVHRAGFDGVEVHSANGYLLNQFLLDTANERTDEYGGSIENRSRFSLEVLAAVTEAVGESKTGIRFSPWGAFQVVRTADPIPTFTYLINTIREKHPNLAYIHLIEPDQEKRAEESNDFARKLWAPRPFLSAGLHDAVSGPKAADERGDVVVYGRYFISNPDLPLRLKRGIELSPYNPKTFYLRGPTQSEGYTDYPFAKQPVQWKATARA